jgi:beta-barrel assembly-enhancing protease
MRAFPATLIATMLIATSAAAAELPAIVHKPTADVYARPAFDAAKLATLPRDTAVMISAQQGLWYELQVSPGKPGYLRVNDVRLAYAGVEDGAANMRVLMGGKAGKGRVTETAGVRGIDESDLKAAAFNKAQLDSMIANRVDGPTAAAYAAEHGWQATSVAYADEAKRGKSSGQSAADASASKAKATKAVGSLLGSLGVNVGSKLDDAAKVVPKSEDELAAEELALGPEITGRILGARPLWNDPAAQRRVNLVGRWVASQTSRPDLPWTFGVIDTPEVNAFAAPGGYILITRGLYELLATDSELAAALAVSIISCLWITL